MLAAAASSTGRRLAMSLSRRGSDADAFAGVGAAVRALASAAGDTDIVSVMASKVPAQQVWVERGRGGAARARAARAPALTPMAPSLLRPASKRSKRRTARRRWAP